MSAAEDISDITATARDIKRRATNAERRQRSRRKDDLRRMGFRFPAGTAIHEDDVRALLEAGLLDEDRVKNDQRLAYGVSEILALISHPVIAEHLSQLIASLRDRYDE